MKKDRELLSTLKVNKKTLIIGIFIIIVSLIGGIILYLLVTKDDAISMRDADHLEMYAQIEGEISSVFATSNNDGKLEKYYLINNNDFYYIIKSIEDMTGNIIFGKTKEIPNEIKEYATLYLKEIGVDINDNNFSNYVSNYLLDSTYNKSDELLKIMLMFGMFILIGVIFIIYYLYLLLRRKSFLNKNKIALKEIQRELKEGNLIHNNICKIYLSDNYLLSYDRNIWLCNLENIIWIYPFERRQHGIPTMKSVCIVDKKGNCNMIGIIKCKKNKSQKFYDQFYNDLMKKSPNALHGYSKTNKEKAISMQFKN